LRMNQVLTSVAMLSCFALAAGAAPRVVLVRPVVGNPQASGTALLTAYAAVTTATPAYPVVLKLLPGTYDVGSTPFALSKPAVDFEGYGREISIITGSGFVTLQINADANLSDLSVVNQGATGFGVVECIQILSGAVQLQDIHVSITNASVVVGVDYIFSAHGRMTNVLVEATSTSNWAEGIEVNSSDPTTFDMDGVVVKAVGGAFTRGMQLGSSTLMNDVRIDSSEGGLDIIATNPTAPVITLTNSRIEGATKFGVQTVSNGASTITVQGSTIRGSAQGIGLGSISTANMGIADTLISGQVSISAPNTLTCVGTYNGSFQPLGASCQ
jgi:hypothetical protein